MLVTDLAYRDMEARADGLIGRITHFFSRMFRRPGSPTESTVPYQLAPEHQAHLRLVSAAEGTHANPAESDSIVRGDYRWRRHPQLLNRDVNQAAPDTDDVERSARSAAVRGLFLARSGRIVDARTAFATAAAEESVDLTAIPGFWELSRGGMMAAVGAYEDADRFRDAAALGARIRLNYRPRSVSVLPNLATRRKSASGS